MPVSELKQTLRDAEREKIASTLFDCGNNVSHAARELGIHRRTLQRKMRRMEAEGRKNKGRKSHA